MGEHHMIGHGMMGGGGLAADLLDQFSGANLALSVRRLRRGYTGFAMKLEHPTIPDVWMQYSENGDLDLVTGFTEIGLNPVNIASTFGASNVGVDFWNNQNDASSLISGAINNLPTLDFYQSGVFRTDSGRVALRPAGLAFFQNLEGGGTTTPLPVASSFMLFMLSRNLTPASTTSHGMMLSGTTGSGIPASLMVQNSRFATNQSRAYLNASRSSIITDINDTYSLYTFFNTGTGIVNIRKNGLNLGATAFTASVATNVFWYIGQYRNPGDSTHHVSNANCGEIVHYPFYNAEYITGVEANIMQYFNIGV
jgi:hypothetical protein